MAEYISREAAMLQIDAADFVRDDNFEGGATLLFCDDVVDRLSAIPAADVRPVVTCVECKWWTKQEASLQGRCELLQMYPTGAWFCANGKREES